MTSSLRSSPLPLLVGRERELAVLRQHLNAAIAGNGSLVLIGGEAGIGKTALVETLCQEATEQGVLVLIGRTFDLAETPPYGPWIDMFAHYRPTDSLPPPPAPFAERGTVGAVASQAALFHAVFDFLAAVASQRSLVLLLEDTHWQDTASLDLLRFLAREIAALPVLLLVTYRSDELTRRDPLYQLLPVLERESRAVRLDLRRLSTDAVRSLVTVRHLRADADIARLVGWLDKRAGGNAFFTLQLLRALGDEGVLQSDGDDWTLGDLASVRLPLAVRQVIDMRVSRLDAESQRLLAIAAVIGQDVPLDVWARVAAADEETLVGVTERAIEAFLVDASSTSVRFVHALIREALYESIVPPRRRGWHQRVGEVLAASEHPDPDAVAYHFQQASDAHAVAWLIAAGARAMRAHANPTAIARFDRALALMDLMHEGDTPERAWLLVRLSRVFGPQQPHQIAAPLAAAAQIAAHLDDPALDAVILYFRGGSHFFLGDFAQGVTELRAGVAALDALSPGDRQRLTHLLGVTIDTLHGTLILFLATTGHLREAVTLGEREVPPDLTSGGWFRGLVMADACLGDPKRAEAQFQRACDLDRAARNYFQLSADYVTYLFYHFPYHADNLPERQHLAAAGEAAWEQAIRALPDLQQPQIAWLPLLFVEGRWEELAHLIPTLRTSNMTYQGLIVSVVGPLARVRGDETEAWQRVREILPHGPATAPGGTMFVVGQQMQRLAAALALDSGDLPAAKDWLEAHDQWLEWSGALLGQSEGQTLWAHYHRQRDDRTRAYAHAECALKHATEPHQPLAFLAAQRLLGELDSEAGRYDDAARHLDAALALADACAAPYERAVTLVAMAELQAATGDIEGARALLDEVQAICTPLGATPTLARAAVLAARLDAAPTTIPSYPAGLSAREVEVLQLVAEGLSNPQVGERLFLSPRTVEQHLRSIFIKTGVASRVAAARWAAEHHLV